ncbi:dihydrofolate reductase family protein [Agromyces bauzanensis]
MARPKVITHNTASVDGRIALSPGIPLMFDPRWTSLAGEGDPYARVLSEHRPGALLEGSGSLVADGAVPDALPAATEDGEILLEDFLPEDAVARAHRGWMTFADSRGRVRWLYKEWPGEDWAGWHLLVLAAERTPLEYLSYLRREGIPYLIVGRERVDLAAALDRLGDRFGITTVVSTGGARLNGALLRAGVVDEIEIEVAPWVTGGTTTPALFTAPDLEPEEMPTRLRLLGIEQLPQERVLLRYAVDRTPS